MEAKTGFVKLGKIFKMSKNINNSFLPQMDIIEFFDSVYTKYERYWYSDLDEDRRYSVILNHSQNWDVLLKHINTTTPGVVLDLGAGEGTDAIKLALLGFEVDAVEGSAVGAEKIEAFSQKAKVKVNVFHTDVNDFEPKRMYDVVICNGLLHYIEDKHAILRKIERATNKNGFGLLSLFSDFTPMPECHRVVNVYPDTENGIVQSFFDSSLWKTPYFQFQRNRLDISHPGFPKHYHSFIKMVVQKTE